MQFRRKNIRLHPIHYRGRRWYFVTVCCDARRPVFAEDNRAVALIKLMKQTAGLHQFAVHAFCVMPDHFHALVEGMTEESDLLSFVRNLKQASSKEHARGGDAPLWQKKFYDHILRSEDSPDAVSWYIWMNPVRKGHCSQPIQYPYSGSLTKEWQTVLRPREPWVPTWKANPSRPSTNRTASTKPAQPLKSERALPGLAGQGPQNTRIRSGSSGDVFGLVAFGALFHLKLDHLAFVQCLVSVHLNGGEVHEHVFARLALDETIPL